MDMCKSVCVCIMCAHVLVWVCACVCGCVRACKRTLNSTCITVTQGAPSFVRLYEYPRLDPAAMVASKSFYRADTVKFHWNKKGDSLACDVNATYLSLSDQGDCGEENHSSALVSPDPLLCEGVWLARPVQDDVLANLRHQ